MSDVKKVNIFLSYSRYDGKTADKIDKYFANSNVIIKRDIRNIETWGSIRDFMKSIREQDFAILIVSGKYLKSSNCMYEAIEIMKEQKYAERIFPLVTDKKIYESVGRSGYIKHWQEKCGKMEGELKTLDRVNSLKLTEDLKRLRNIAENIGEFMDAIADMNNPDENNLVTAIVDNLHSRGIKIIKDGYMMQPQSGLGADEKNQYLKMIESLQNQLKLEQADKHLLKTRLTMERKGLPPKLQTAIESERDSFPELHDINMHFAFECAGINITAGYVLHSLRKEAIKGSTPLAMLCTINNVEEELGLLVSAVSMRLNEKSGKSNNPCHGQ